MLEIHYLEPRSNNGRGITYMREDALASFMDRYTVTSITDAPPAPAWSDPVDNCLYGGNAVGHSKGFCTADSCY